MNQLNWEVNAKKAHCVRNVKFSPLIVIYCIAWTAREKRDTTLYDLVGELQQSHKHENNFFVGIVSIFVFVS